MDASYLDAVERGDMEAAVCDRRGEGTDAQEITRFMLPDPAPSDAFCDEIPIFDEQGNEIDFNTLSPEKAKAIIDDKVCQMLEEEIVNEVVSHMVGYLQIDKTIPTFEGQISIEEFIDAWKEEIAKSKYSNDVKEVFFAALPLVKENINYQKKQYGAERTNTIVIPRKEHAGSVEGGYVESSLQSDKESRPIEAFSRNAAYDRRGEGADAQEVTRFRWSWGEYEHEVLKKS